MFKYIWIVGLAILYAIWAVISIIDIIVSLKDEDEFCYLYLLNGLLLYT